jgi:hypothetical protein
LKKRHGLITSASKHNLAVVQDVQACRALNQSARQSHFHPRAEHCPGIVVVMIDHVLFLIDAIYSRHLPPIVPSPFIKLVSLPTHLVPSNPLHPFNPFSQLAHHPHRAVHSLIMRPSNLFTFPQKTRSCSPLSPNILLALSIRSANPLSHSFSMFNTSTIRQFFKRGIISSSNRESYMPTLG